MVSAIDSAVSGLNASFQRLNVSANNIANAQSKNYTPQQLTQSTDATGNVTTGTEAASSNDEAQQLINANIAKYDAQGNISVIKAQEQMNQSLLDIVS